MTVDQSRFHRRLRAILASKRAQGIEADLATLQTQVDRSSARRQQRENSRAQVSIVFPDDLPIVQRRSEIAHAIDQHQVVIICGETGSGKTTQLPKICLQLGRGVSGMIGHTQPRRIAARTIAARIAAELQTPLGNLIGYKVRFSDKTSGNALIKVMTDGILLAETQQDRDLRQYDTIIIDEAHERSLNIDFLLGYLKQLLPRRPDLKVIVTSATIDPQRFSSHFNGAPIVEVSGRVYPVETRYRPVQSEEPDEDDPTILDAIVSAVGEIQTINENGAGDVLIFLSGEREIRETSEALAKAFGDRFQVLPLYARQSVDEQNRVFDSASASGRQRIILATNVAETSLTVPGIKYVIDPGLARISRYSSNARVQRLPIERISQASADQRKGRCGRIEAGVCFRLYSEDDFASRSPFTDPEILRSNLANVILQMKALRLGEIERFPFIEAPRSSSIREGYQTLHELGAIDDNGNLTPVGNDLARLPVDPRIGRMILAARQENSLSEVLVIASALATQDPRLRPLDAAKAADAAHQQFADERSDFLGLLRLWDFYHQQASELSSNKLRKLCQGRYLSYMRLREWQDVHQQLRSHVIDSGMKLNAKAAAYEDIHRALLTGLVTNVGFKHEGNEYLGVRDRRFHVFPGSGLFQNSPRWVMAAELVETTRLYARTVARVQPEWIEQLAKHLVKRSYTAPYWNARSAHVEAFERVTLYGLTLVPKRRVHFGRIDARAAREIFIHQALIEGNYRTDGAFAEFNRQLINQVRNLEAKRRRRDVMVDAAALFGFFDKRLPQDITNGPSFEKWRRAAERENPNILFMSREDLMRSDAHAADAADFPDFMQINSMNFPLRYRFEPGHADDGVTLVVPVEAAKQLTPEALEWIVPGMLREKISSLIKTLPKPLRVNFVPAPDFAEACERTIDHGNGSLLDQVADRLFRMAGVEIPRSAWHPEQVPDFLHLNVHVVDLEGKVVASGRDLSQVRQQLGDVQVVSFPSSAPDQFNRNYITTWDFGDLQERVPVQRGGMSVYAYPALIDEKSSVSLCLLDSPAAAHQASRAGVRRLFVLAVREELLTHIEYLPGIDEMCLHYAPIGSSAQLKSDLIDLTADQVFLGENPHVTTQNEFERRLRSGWNNLWTVASEVSALVGRILAAHHNLDLQLADADNPFWSDAIADIRAQLANLTPAGFLLSTPYRWIQCYPRYLQAISARLRKLSNAGLARDRHATAEIQHCWAQYLQRKRQHDQLGIIDPELDLYRWMIEELRVSHFAQELRTAVPVSSKRMEQQWDKTVG